MADTPPTPAPPGLPADAAPLEANLGPRPASAIRGAVRHLAMPVLAALIVLAARIAGPFIGPYPDWGQQFLVVLQILSMGWLVIKAIDAATDLVLARFDVTVEDNLQARRVHTQAHVLRRTLHVLIIALVLGGVLMTFDRIRQVGISVMASAGVAGLAIGLAARPTLENLIAGIQIAVTQPIRLDDVVIVEGEYGQIEEIASTYVVVRIWDERRLVVPLRRFIDTPFENWTRTTSRMMGTVMFYCDYETDIAPVRREVSRLAALSGKWDGRVANVEVTDVTERSMQLRVLLSAASASKLWDLRVFVREGLIKFLRTQGATFPLARTEIATRDSSWTQRTTERGDPIPVDRSLPPRQTSPTAVRDEPSGASA